MKGSIEIHNRRKGKISNFIHEFIKQFWPDIIMRESENIVHLGNNYPL